MTRPSNPETAKTFDAFWKESNQPFFKSVVLE